MVDKRALILREKLNFCPLKAQRQSKATQLGFNNVTIKKIIIVYFLKVFRVINHLVVFYIVNPTLDSFLKAH